MTSRPPLLPRAALGLVALAALVAFPGSSAACAQADDPPAAPQQDGGDNPHDQAPQAQDPHDEDPRAPDPRVQAPHTQVPSPGPDRTAPRGDLHVVLAHRKISATQGGFEGVIDDSDRFGSAVAHLGDVDGDGIGDIAVGAIRDDDGAPTAVADRGAVWILFLRADGSVREHAKLSAASPPFSDLLADGDRLGRSLAGLGDVDGDGIPDLAAGAVGRDVGGQNCGAVFVVSLTRVGGVKSWSEIGAGNALAGELDPGDGFGVSLGALGDLDGDGVPDLVAGAFNDDDGADDSGALWIVTLQRDGSAASTHKISATRGGFEGPLRRRDQFAASVCALGDLDGNGVTEIAVGAIRDDDGGEHHNADRGAVWILFLRDDGSVLRHQKISMLHGDFPDQLGYWHNFGSAVAGPGDFDGDGTLELVVGARSDPDGGGKHGAAWVLSLGPDARVVRSAKISSLRGGFAGPLAHYNQFGSSAAALGDLDGNGVPDLAVGASGDFDGSRDEKASRGAVWVLLLQRPEPVDDPTAPAPGG